MNIDWPTLAIWFVTAIGVFIACLSIIWVTGWGDSGTLVEFVVFVMTMWVFSTGIVRSVTDWNIWLCWCAGLPLIYPVMLVLGFPLQLFALLIFEVIPRWWRNRNYGKN